MASAEPEAITEARLDAEAEADIVAGRVVSHAEVAKWLASWGSADELRWPEL